MFYAIPTSRVIATSFKGDFFYRVLLIISFFFTTYLVFSLENHFRKSGTNYGLSSVGNRVC